MSDTQRWLLYALGGGLGHITRALALARRARARGHDVLVLSNSALVHAIPYERELAGATLEIISPGWDRDQVAQRVHAILAGHDFDVLVVDTFARGLGGELAARLPALPVPRVLVHRFVCAEYVARASLHAFAAHYDAILVPGEPAPLGGHAHAIATAPWLIRDAGELWERGAARRALGAHDQDHAPLVLVMGSGREDEIREAAALSETLRAALGARAAVRFAAPGLRACPWPLLPALPGVDVLVAAGGYNTVHEARATGVPLVAFARPRRYDRQADRLRASERVADAGQALARVRALLEPSVCSERERERARARPAYENGVHAAVHAIEQTIGRTSGQTIGRAARRLPS